MLKKVAVSSLLFIVLFLLVSFLGLKRIGAWNLFFPSMHHETVPPQIPVGLQSPALLVFSKTNSYRHIDGIAGGISFFDELAASKGWGVYHTENSAVFNKDDLTVFSVVIFNNVTGDVLSTDQEQAFKSWLEAGGGWLGIHGAGDDSHAGWDWYRDQLIGAHFIAHTMGPQFQQATLFVDDTTHIATKRLPLSWDHKEEWYSWNKSVRNLGFNVLVSVDESTYSPRYVFMGRDTDLRMGDHPVIWNRCVGLGRSLYSALGHNSEAFDSQYYQKLLEGALDWILDDSACTLDLEEP